MAILLRNVFGNDNSNISDVIIITIIINSIKRTDWLRKANRYLMTTRIVLGSGRSNSWSLSRHLFNSSGSGK